MSRISLVDFIRRIPTVLSRTISVFGGARRRRVSQMQAPQSLEVRALLASVMDSGTTLQVQLELNERVEVVSNGTSYELTSTNSTFANGGVTEAADFSAFGAANLVLNDLAQYTDIQFVDTAAGTSVRFPSSGTGVYSHDFNINLDDGAFAQSVVFNGTANFGSHNLTANTDGSIQLFTGTDLTVSEGNISLTAVNETDGSIATKGIGLVGAKVTTSGTGDILLNGTGPSAAGLSFLDGVFIAVNSALASTSTSADAGTITLNGAGGVGQNFGQGVFFSESSLVSSMGDVAVTGIGGDGSGASNLGIRTRISTIESTGTGADAATILLDGTGAGQDQGVGLVVNEGAIIRSVDGDVTMNGVGGNGSGGSNRGFDLFGFGRIESTGTGSLAANISISGTGGDGGEFNHALSSSPTETAAALISSVDGDIQIDGTTGQVLTNGRNSAVYIASPIQATGDGNITVNGTATFGTFLNRGVFFAGRASVSTNSGDLVSTGIGAQGSGDQNDGITVSNEATLSTSSGLISLDGTSGTNNSHGVEIFGNADGGGRVRSTGGGRIQIIAGGAGTGAKNDFQAFDNATIGGPGATGDISIAADTMELSPGVVVQSSGKLNIAPMTQGLGAQSISLGYLSPGGRTDLNLTDSELATIQSNFASITVGSTGLADNQNSVTVDSVQLSPALTIVGGTITDSAGSDFDVSSTILDGTINASVLQSTGDLVLATGSTLSIEAAGDVPGEGYQQHGQVATGGRVDIQAGVALNVSRAWSWRPSGGEKITIVSRGSGSGTFAGLAEGAVIADFLNATISYVGGDGNDIELTLPETLPEFPNYVSLGDVAVGGITVYGLSDGGRVGQSVNAAGDINGDGIDDFLVGGNEANTTDNGFTDAGEAYLIYGNEDASHVVDIANLGARGVVFHGAGESQNTGHFVDAADFNNDGYNDVLIGAHRRSRTGARPSAGAAYIIWGGPSLPQSLDLANLGSVGVTILGPDAGDLAGNPVAAIGDVNNDGIQDLGVGSIWADSLNNSRDRAGEAHIIFGATSMPSVIDLATATTGVMRIYGSQAGDEAGVTVAGLGDIDGDSIDDFAIGARFADGADDLVSRAGEAYVFYGGTTLPASVDLASGADVVIYGADIDDFAGWPLQGRGDVNGDGYNDLFYGAFGGDSVSNQRPNAGEAYLIWGGPLLPAEIHSDNLGRAGVTIFGANAGDLSGRSVSIVGDLNTDGFDDLAIGGYQADGIAGATNNSGEVAIILGGNSLPQTIDLNDSDAADFVLFGADVGDEAGIMVRGAGDVNNDGVDDLIIGARHADSLDESRLDAGEAYVIFGNSLFDSETVPETPEVTGPIGRITDQLPTITWSEVSDADTFELTLELVGGANNPILSRTVTSNSYQLTTPLPLGRYRSSVRSNRSDGSQSEWAIQTFSVALESHIHDLPFHANDSLTPTIQWDAVDGAASYRLFISNVTEQSTVLDVTVTNTSYVPTVDFEFGQHRIWVRPISAENFAGRWSVGENYYVGPQIRLPNVSTFNSRPTFSWDDSANVESVQIYIQKSGSVVVNELGVTGDSYTPAAPLEDGVYYWWVRPSAAGGNVGEWSDRGRVSVGGASTIVGADDSVTKGLAVIDWEPIEEAAWYEIYLLNEDTGNVFRKSGLSESTFTSNPLPDGNYRIWVRSYRSNGSPALWSGAHHFVVTSPAGNLNTAPVNSVVSTFDATPPFFWGADLTALSFNFYATDGETIIQQTGINSRSWTPSENLSPAVWHWWVQPMTSGGAVGQWSSRGTVDTTARAVLSDTVAVGAGLATLNWNAVGGASRYVLQIANVATGESVVREENLTSLSFTTASSLTSGTYRAWVQAVSSGGVLAPWSFRVEFRVNV